MSFHDKIKGALLGTAVGDALGMPVEGLSHQNVRMYYRGIKAYRDDEKRGDLKAGQWTDDTQFTFALARALEGFDRSGADGALEALCERVRAAYRALLPEARRWGPTSRAAVESGMRGAVRGAPGPAERPTNGAAMRAAPLGAWWAASGADRDQAFAIVRAVLGLTHHTPGALAAGFGQAFAVREALLARPTAFDADGFFAAVQAACTWAEERLGDADRACSRRLERLAGNFWMFPLDLQDLCDGTGIRADASWPFAVAMFARGADLIEATLLSTVNVGGDADTTGAMAGALLGALHGWSAFPDAWRTGLEAAAELEDRAERFAANLVRPRQNSPTNEISGSIR